MQSWGDLRNMIGKLYDISKDSYIIKINTKNIALHVHFESDLVDFIASDKFINL